MTSVPVLGPAPGWTTMPEGLSMTMTSVVLVDDLERDVLGLELASGLGDLVVDLDAVAGLELVAGFPVVAVDATPSLVDDLLDLGPAQAGILRARKTSSLVPPPGVGRDDEFRFRHVCAASERSARTAPGREPEDAEELGIGQAEQGRGALDEDRPCPDGRRGSTR